MDWHSHWTHLRQQVSDVLCRAVPCCAFCAVMACLGLKSALTAMRDAVTRRDGKLAGGIRQLT